jgi:formylglycine-generating enzyme required for sulfatase activity
MESCYNSYGIHDMSGGVWEWTSSDFDAPILSTGLPEEMQSLAEIRGGSWMVGPQKGLCRPVDGYPVTSKNMAYEDLGFRCCRGEEWKPQDLSWGSTEICPDYMVRIGDFCIDVFEYPNTEGKIPTGSLQWSDAQEECESVGKRVCTEAEWTLACEGPEWNGYPYGATYQSGVCASKDTMLGGQLAKSGRHLKCQTSDGVFDMTGNLWEWVALDTGEGGVLRGGGSMLSAGLGRCRSRAFIREGDSTSIDVGTRCCLTPTP